MKTSIVILTFNKIGYTKECIESIREYTPKDEYEIIVVDNNSTDTTKDWLREQNDLNVIYNAENLGFPAGCNMGIKESNKENDILLLNNDTVVTNNWLVNLKKCLYSSEDIGAVGPVSNSCPYYQTIDTDYKKGNEMQYFALKYNKPNSDKWEERQKLIGFCMLIKRKALDRTGLLDESFSPGNYEDDDYSIRLMKNGFKLYLCKDTFIHHYGSVSFSNNDKYSSILAKNEKKFKAKWGFTSREDMNIYKSYQKMISIKDAKILEIYCGTGATAMYLKQKINCDYYVYDDNKKALRILPDGIKIFDCYSDDKRIVFDYVIITKAKEFVKNDIFTGHFKQYINYKTKFILNLSEEEYNDGIINTIFDFDCENEYELDDGIKEANINSDKLNRYYLIFKNKKSYEELVKVILQRESKTDYEVDEIKKIIKYGILNETDFECIITNYIDNKMRAYNFVAIIAFEMEQYDIIIPLLNRAYSINKDDLDTRYNLAYVLKSFGENEIALNYLEGIEGRNSEVDYLIDSIKKSK